MPKVTVSAYDDLPKDVNDQVMPVAPHSPLYSASFATTGQTAVLPDESRFVRVATDTAIQIKRNGAGAAVATDDLMPANSVEFFAVHEGTIISWLPA